MLSPAARDASGEPTGSRYPTRRMDAWRSTTATSGSRTPTGASRRGRPAHIGRDAFPPVLARREDDRIHEQPHGKRRRVRRPASGGELRQVTFNTVNDTVLYWSPDGRRVIFATQRGDSTVGSPLYSVSVDGGLPEPPRWTQRQPE